MIIFNKAKREARKTLSRVDGARIKYVTERSADGTEKVIGRNGAVSVNDERALLLCEGKAVFSCAVDEVRCSELLSGDGAIFIGRDIETGREMSVTAHFTSPILRR